jgi:CDP-glucose 4,6-dehydratase
VNLLDSAREVGSVRSIVIVSSDKCYENVGGSEPFTENSPMGGHDPYSASKGCTELVAASFRRSFFFEGACALATARAGNVIGGGDWAADRIIPDVMRAAYTSTPVFIRRPDAVRPWQHVLEPLRGYLMLARGLAGDRRFAGGWNFGPSIEDTCSVRKVVEKVTALWPGIEVEFAEEPFGPHEAGSLMLDCTKARRQLDWRPVLSIDDMLASTIEWYRETRDHPHRAMGISLQQIRSFEAQCQRSRGVQSA